MLAGNIGGGSKRSAGVGRTYVVSSDVDLGQLEEPVTLRASLDDFLEYEVHPVVAIGEVAVQCLAVLQFHEHRVALGGREEPERQLFIPLEGFLWIFSLDYCIGGCDAPFSLDLGGR